MIVYLSDDKKEKSYEKCIFLPSDILIRFNIIMRLRKYTFLELEWWKRSIATVFKFIRNPKITK